jgi:FtsP/CotA-like multicopper oxidase with cupredoxin domain
MGISASVLLGNAAEKGDGGACSNGFARVRSAESAGSSGGYLRSAVTVDELTVAPGERYMVLVDFSAMSPCESVILQNTAAAPFPAGDPADPDTTGQIMQFTATNCDGIDMPCLPEVLNPQHAEGFPNLGSPDVVRRLTLNEIMGENGPLMLVLDGQRWSAPISEMPVEGTIEQWVVANPTMDTHPIHLHLVQFQVVSRQAFDVDAYMTDWLCANGMPPDPAAGLMAPLDHPTVPICTENYLLGEPTGPNPEETGWKDTVKMNPGEVTVIKVRFSPVDGSKNYSFDPTEGPGYVWHCHILDHEDNEMMRPYVVVSAPKPDCE